MTFVKLNGVWYEKQDGDSRLYNYADGWVVYEPSTDKFEQTVICENWHELYQRTDFTIGADKTSDAWLSPAGELFYCDCHYIGAEDILEVVFGETNYDKCFKQADDVLCDKGWVRLTSSAMWYVRLDDWCSMRLTQAQMDKTLDWCVEHGLPVPQFDS